MSTTTVPLNPIFDYPTISDRGTNLLRRIASSYGLGDSPDQATVMMDGVQFMMQKSLSMACATELTAPLPPIDGTDQGVPGLSGNPSFQKCRKCAGEYVVQLGNGGSITIIAGMPKPNTIYKTMSYVWGPHPKSPLSVPCVQCGHVTLVPMINAQRFRNLTELGGDGNTIWIDAISINQFNEEDVASHVVVMGHIYRNAKCVSVLLPASDKPAYECLKEIDGHAKVILLHYANFVENSDITIEDSSSGERFQILSVVCELFLENLKRLGEHLHQFSYWSRAWTFQEWALANDLEIALEGGTADSCFNLKSLVLGAAMLISRYKILQHQYAQIKLGRNISRGLIPPIFNSIKALFPDEDLFLSYEEIDLKEVSFQTNFPHFGINHLLGIRSIPPSPTAGSEFPPMQTPDARPDPLTRLRARLMLLLSAFASSERKASHEADLVACWASMCNISYAYDRHDDFTKALTKVVKVLRTQGIIVYDFLPDTVGGVSTSTELFNAYVRYHPQLNATNQAEFPGSPIFTGRVDTVSHLIYSLNKVNLPTQWNDKDEGPGLPLRKVVGAKIEHIIDLGGNLQTGMSAFAEKGVYGESLDTIDGIFWPVEKVITLYLEKIPSQRRSTAKLIVVKIPFHKAESRSPSSYDLYTWAIVPMDINNEELIICREPINGALTLTINKHGGTRIIAYLTLSDHFSGTFLVKANEEGLIDMTLTVPERGDIQHSAIKQIAIRQLHGRVHFDEPPSIRQRKRRFSLTGIIRFLCI